MKKLLLLISVFTITTLVAQEEVIMTIDGKPVYKSEFEYIFKKNNKNSSFTQKELDEYMDLFVKFKLKVTEARELKLDTLPKLKTELEGYRAQLAHQYLFDAEVTDKLINEAYDRMKYDIHASHILIRIGLGDTLVAYKKINDIYAKLEKGENFQQLAVKYSEDPSAKNNNGDLGYFSAFRMVYPFETGVYSTPVGRFSKPIRTRFGYHIVYVHDKRPARVKIHAAHILIKIDSTRSNISKEKIDEIYSLLNSGKDFAELARTYSDDKVSSKNGGDLGWFSSGDMIPEFEEVAYSLQEQDEFSKPFKTQFGWHIVKLINKGALGSLEDNLSLIKTKINRDERAQMSRISKIEQLKKEYKFQVNKDVRKKLNKIITKENFDKGTFKSEMADKYSNDIIFTFADQKLDAKTFILSVFEANRSLPPDTDINTFIDNEISAIGDNRIIQYERSILEEKYPKFRALMNEYADGVLLFELTDQRVWGKAIKDTAGLSNYYELHKNEFMWENRIDVDILSTSNKKYAKSAYKMMKKGISADSTSNKINSDSQLNMSLEKGVFEVSKHDILKGNSWNKSLYKPEQIEGKYYIFNVKEILPAQPKKLNEARGLITSRYQDELEQEWIKELNKKHKVEIKKEVLYSIK